MMALKDYEVTETRFIGGQHRKAGELIQMTARAAKYYVAPYGSGLKPAAKAHAKPAAKMAKTEG